MALDGRGGIAKDNISFPFGNELICRVVRVSHTLYFIFPFASVSVDFESMTTKIAAAVLGFS